MAWVRPGMQRGYNFVPFFPLTNKLDVNGENAHPIMKHLRETCPPPIQEYKDTQNLLYEPKHGNDIRWNFEKWLIDKHGIPFRRYSSFTEPANLEEDISFLLGDSVSPTKIGSSYDLYHETYELSSDFEIE